VAVFLLSILGVSPGLASHRLAGQGIDVLRVWETPSTDVDYLVVRARDRSEVRQAAAKLDLPLRGGRSMLVEGPERRTDREIEALLPAAIPDSLSEQDLVGWIDPAWTWCDKCRKWHARDRHTR
jgi:hypothetical protein